MKYLKTFEGLTTSTIDKIKSDIKDICVELTDIGFDIYIYQCPKSIYQAAWMDIKISKSGVYNLMSYKFNEIYEYMEMVTDYLKEYGVEFSYIIDGLNYNEEEYSHYIQRRIDKNHTFHKDVPNIVVFKIRIKLEDETYK